MITDASETRFQAKQHPGVLCAIHPDQPFDFAEKAYSMFPDPALKAFVDQWLHLTQGKRRIRHPVLQVVPLRIESGRMIGRPMSRPKLKKYAAPASEAVIALHWTGQEP